ncbi:MAG: hypothetical protein JWL70_2057 [Acidimicrobiia bacterium]|nr:hypothetical protein [Acidimicrobiia bacterium]
MILATGELAPLSTDRDLARELSRQGLVDLLCGTNASTAPPRRGLRARAREALTTTRAGSVVLSRAHQAGRVPLNFVHDPAFEGTFEVNRLVVKQGELFRLPVHLRNTGSSWWNSRFPQHPVTASYRWAPSASAHDRSSQPEDGIRTLFRAPVGPGQRASLELTVKAPPAPGPYELIMTLVQESFAWFDDLDGRLQLRLPVTVEAQTA